MQSQAIVFRQANQPSLESVDLPSLGAGEVRIRTVYSGVSIGTEQSIFSGRRTENGTFPLVGGYMSSGIVDDVGADVSHLAPGDRVVAGPGRLEGNIASIWAGHMAVRIVHTSQVVKIPQGVRMRDAAMFILPNVGLHALAVLPVTDQDTVLVQGQGLIGQCYAQLAAARGARVIALEVNPHRADLARKLATEHVLDPTQQDVSQSIDRLTNGRGPDIVVEATGNKNLISNATNHLRYHSKMVFLGWYDGSVQIDYHHHFHANEVTAYFPTGAGDQRTTHATLLNLQRRTLILADNITDVVPAEGACDAYRRFIAGDPSIMGMVIQWSQP